MTDAQIHSLATRIVDGISAPWKDEAKSARDIITAIARSHRSSGISYAGAMRRAEVEWTVRQIQEADA
jgi:hypothetical protein